MPLHVSSTCAHHQEITIVLHSLWYHHTYRCDDTTSHVNSTHHQPLLTTRERETDYIHLHNIGNSIQSLGSFLNFHELSFPDIEELEVGKRIWFSSEN